MAFLQGGFWIGIHRLSLCKYFPRSFVSANRLRGRVKGIRTQSWIMDSGAFTEISSHGRYRQSVEEYAALIRVWAHTNPFLRACVSQDYMCEDFILQKTGLTVPDHQRMTIERYDGLVQQKLPIHLMPVLQGYKPEEYIDHLQQYGDRLGKGMWAGVGSVCKRNSTDTEGVYRILSDIKAKRPDLRLHGFGLKITALEDERILELLYSADSLAWSYSARRKGLDQNSLTEARKFWNRIHEVVNAHTRRESRSV